MWTRRPACPRTCTSVVLSLSYAVSRHTTHTAPKSLWVPATSPHRPWHARRSVRAVFPATYNYTLFPTYIYVYGCLVFASVAHQEAAASDLNRSKSNFHLSLRVQCAKCATGARASSKKGADEWEKFLIVYNRREILVTHFTHSFLQPWLRT